MTERVLMIGQFPPPITGEGKVNLQVKEMLVSSGYLVDFINSSVISDVNDVGKMSFTKILKTVMLICSSLPSIWKTDILYITPGQTYFGVLRFLPFLLLASLCNKKIIVHWHGYGVLSLLGRNKALINCYFSSRYKNIVLTNDLLVKLKLHSIDIDNTFVLGNFSEIEGSVSLTERASSKLNVIYLGGLMPEKGILSFFEAANLTSVHNYFLYGSGGTEVTKAAKDLHVAGKLKYMGVIDGEAKINAFLQSDVFVLQTSYPTEGVPLTILEAMSCGCAIVTTAHNGIPETVGDAALFIQPDDVTSLINALDLLSSNRDLLQRLKQSAIDRSKIFTKKAFQEKLSNIIGQ